MNGYDLSRAWFDWCFEHPDLVTPNHTALYFFAIEHCNRLGWKSKFGFPTEMAKDAVGIKSYRTYINTLNDIVEWGFIEMVERSKNQYSANIVALVKNAKANVKALAKATQKQGTKQRKSTGESKASIDKPITIEPINQLTNEQYYRSFAHLFLKFNDFDMLIAEGWDKSQIDQILDAIENFAGNKKYKSLLLTARNWLRKDHKPSKLATVLQINEDLKAEIIKKHAQ